MWWKLLGGAAAVAIVLGIAWMALDLFGDARHAAGVAEERNRWQERRIADVQAEARRQIGHAERGTAAVSAGVERIAALIPAILQSERSVSDYAKTPAGLVLCRDAGRVRAVDAFDEYLFTPAPAPGGGGKPLPADSPAPAG